MLDILEEISKDIRQHCKNVGGCHAMLRKCSKTYGHLKRIGGHHINLFFQAMRILKKRRGTMGMLKKWETLGDIGFCTTREVKKNN
jgi:hypothetical protein